MECCPEKRTVCTVVVGSLFFLVVLYILFLICRRGQFPSSRVVPALRKFFFCWFIFSNYTVGLTVIIGIKSPVPSHFLLQVCTLFCSGAYISLGGTLEQSEHTHASPDPEYGGLELLLASCPTRPNNAEHEMQ